MGSYALRARLLGRNVSSLMGFVVVRFSPFFSVEFKSRHFALSLGQRRNQHGNVENYLSPSDVAGSNPASPSLGFL